VRGHDERGKLVWIFVSRLPGGSVCVDSECAIEYGYSTPFSPCATGANAHIGTGILVGELVSIPVPTKVTAPGTARDFWMMGEACRAGNALACPYLGVMQ
jgi:hypothetical protein